MTNLSNFQFIVLMATSLAAILGCMALFLKAFSGKRKECIDKFAEMERTMKEEGRSIHTQSVAQARADEKFDFIERELKDIKEQLSATNSKIDRLFEIIRELPRRKANGGE